MDKKPKPKTCHECKSKFIRTRAIQPVCQKFDCQISYSAKLSEKRKAVLARADRADTKIRKEKAKSVKDLLDDAQKPFNKFIRLRDRGRPCISCGKKRLWMVAGHFISRGASSFLRMSEQNVHLQCGYCNDALSGNIMGYLPALIEKIGEEAVMELKNAPRIKKWTREEALEIKRVYSEKVKQLMKELE